MMRPNKSSDAYDSQIHSHGENVEKKSGDASNDKEKQQDIWAQSNSSRQQAGSGLSF
jgi:hypothetical protein